MLHQLAFLTLSLCAYGTSQPLSKAGFANTSILHMADREQELRQGWTPSPRERGSMDILWSCTSTIFLCCWSMLCLNVPGRHDTNWTKLWRKAMIFVLTLFTPEVITVAASGQYFAAIQSVKEFKAANIGEWSPQHAFFAEMGGFVLQTKDWVPFPISAKQLLWLIQHKYVTIPPALAGRILDRNKADNLTRFLMVIQTVWFLANFFTRIAQNLSPTALELTTAAFIYASLPTMFFWWHKPADVSVPEILTTNASMAEILLTGGEAAQEPYGHTPLDFLDRREWFWMIYWAHFRAAIRELGIPAGTRVRPIDRFSNFSSAEPPTWFFSLGAIYYFGFCAIFVAGWHLRLPSQREQLLWRVASLTALGTLVGCFAVTEITFRIWPYLRYSLATRKHSNVAETDWSPSTIPFGRRKYRSRTSKGLRPRPRTILDWIRNNTTSQNPRLSLPLLTAVLLQLLCFTHLLARLVIFIEDFAAMRSLPLSCYKTTMWQQFIPHLGQ
ncbi:hypothetical protein J3E74DRAFT_281871 [Bipolaris maydis]|nr:hypothetical protein J3E74DRAFT_281871 [Bipolaris maydis]